MYSIYFYWEKGKVFKMFFWEWTSIDVFFEKSCYHQKDYFETEYSHC